MNDEERAEEARQREFARMVASELVAMIKQEIGSSVLTLAWGANFSTRLPWAAAIDGAARTAPPAASKPLRLIIVMVLPT